MTSRTKFPQLTPQQCLQFLNNPHINPVDGKKLMVGKGPYNDFLRQCSGYGQPGIGRVGVPQGGLQPMNIPIPGLPGQAPGFGQLPSGLGQAPVNQPIPPFGQPGFGQLSSGLGQLPSGLGQLPSGLGQAPVNQSIPPFGQPGLGQLPSGLGQAPVNRQSLHLVNFLQDLVNFLQDLVNFLKDLVKLQSINQSLHLANKDLANKDLVNFLQDLVKLQFFNQSIPPFGQQGLGQAPINQLTPAFGQQGLTQLPPAGQLSQLPSAGQFNLPLAGQLFTPSQLPTLGQLPPSSQLTLPPPSQPPSLGQFSLPPPTQLPTPNQLPTLGQLPPSGQLTPFQLTPGFGSARQHWSDHWYQCWSTYYNSTRVRFSGYTTGTQTSSGTIIPWKDRTKCISCLSYATNN